MDKNILKQLKTDYEDLEIKPSASLWDQIEAGLDSDSEIVQKHTLHWWKYAAVIVLLISVGGLFYFKTDKPLDIKKTIVAKNPSENNFRPTEAIESTIPNEEITKKSVFNKVDVINDQDKFVSEKSIEKIQTPINPEIIVKELKPIEIPVFALQTPQNVNSKTNITEKKKTSYTNADELLLGRELDKTIVESSRSEQFGVVDASKLKIRRPGSLRILGVKVFADSAATE